MIEWFDNHCHLSENTEEEILKARKALVVGFINVGTDFETSCEAIEKARILPDVWATAGVHPHEAKKGIEGIEGQGLPNIEPTPNNAGMMEGMLYDMYDTFLPKLDEFHGYPKECNRKVMDLNAHDFHTVRGIVYFAQPDRIGDKLKPSKALMKLFRKSRKEMTMLYFARLMNTRTCD